MNRKFSLTVFLSAIWRGMCKVFGALGRFFGYQGPESIWRVVGRITAVCFAVLLVIFTCGLVYRLCDEVYGEIRYSYRMSNNWCMEKSLSQLLVYERNYYRAEGRIWNQATQRCVVDEVDWVAVSDDGDSLAVFAKEGYRGFINRFTGEVVVPPSLYTHAWVFSEGLAAVVKEGRLSFIDHQGNVVIDNGLMADVWQGTYLFHHGYCLVESLQYANKWGLMDRDGKWVVEPGCDNICYVDGLWFVLKGRTVCVMSEEMELLLETECADGYVCNGDIFVVSDQQEVRKYMPASRQLSDVLICEVGKLSYETDEIQPVTTRTYDDEGHLTGVANEGETYTVQAYADCYRYSSRPGWYGLMSRDGKVITPPLYSEIEAIDRGLYLCTGTLSEGVILNNKGEVVK